MVVSIGQARRHDGVSNCHHLIQSLGFEEQAHHSGMEVTAVADHLTVHVRLQHRPHDGGPVLVEQTHGIEGVGGGLHPPPDGFHGCLIIRA